MPNVKCQNRSKMDAKRQGALPCWTGLGFNGVNYLVWKDLGLWSQEDRKSRKDLGLRNLREAKNAWDWTRDGLGFKLKQFCASGGQLDLYLVFNCIFKSQFIHLSARKFHQVYGATAWNYLQYNSARWHRCRLWTNDLGGVGNVAYWEDMDITIEGQNTEHFDCWMGTYLGILPSWVYCKFV